MEWLISAGLIHKVSMVSQPSIPLTTYSNDTMFKIYFVDVGLLRKLAGVQAKYVFDKTDSYKQFKGAVAENHVLNELISMGKHPYYWRSKWEAEVDFISMFGTSMVPIEIKSETNTKSKSLTVYRGLYHPRHSVKVSMNNVGGNDGVIAIPLWMVWRLDRLMLKMDSKNEWDELHFD